ncbi:MAG: alkylphosphonate utilization protein [Clostridiales bacterium]|jgi:protein PhnA|nr:alkylphosphonate utilization protein [Clostridiales bacterium]
MSEMPNCPSCNSEYTYENMDLFVCSQCAYEWNKEEDSNDVIKDAHGNVLNDGDSVIVIKDLKVKGSSSSVKKGTKVKSIKLIHDASDGHDIDCKIDGFGAMKLKSEFVKKA